MKGAIAVTVDRRLLTQTERERRKSLYDSGEMLLLLPYIVTQAKRISCDSTKLTTGAGAAFLGAAFLKKGFLGAAFLTTLVAAFLAGAFLAGAFPTARVAKGAKPSTEATHRAANATENFIVIRE